MPKAIVLDFDGIIVDSEPLHYRAFARVIGDMGGQFSYDDYLDRYAGFDDRDGFRAILRDTPALADVEAGDRDLISKLCEQKAKVFEDVVGEGVVPIAGVIDLINDIGEQAPIAIASGATRRDIDLILSTLSLTQRFDPLITADDVQRSKPDPATYTLAVNGLAARRPELAIEPHQCLAIEDTPAGIESAKRAGLKTLGVATTYPSEKLTIADRVVQTMQDITFDQLRDWFDQKM